MYQIRKALAAVAVVGFMFGAVQAANAQPSPPISEDKIVKTVGRMVMTCVRPSTIGKKIEVGSPDVKIVDDRRIDVKFVVNWNGRATGAKYQSRFTLKMYFSNDRYEIVAVEYWDNAILPADMRPITQLVSTLNELLESQRR